MIHNGQAVIGDSDSPGFVKGFEIRDLYPLHSDRCITGHIYVQGHFGCLILHVFKCFDIVASGIGITHHYDGGISALNRSCGTCLNVFFCGETGISEVYVDVYESGCNNKSLRIDYFIAVFG